MKDGQPQREVTHTMRCAHVECTSFLCLTVGGACELRSVGQALSDLAALGGWRLAGGKWHCPGCRPGYPYENSDDTRSAVSAHVKEQIR